MCSGCEVSSCLSGWRFAFYLVGGNCRVERNETVKECLSQEGDNVATHSDKQRWVCEHHSRCGATSHCHTVAGNAAKTIVLSFHRVICKQSRRKVPDGVLQGVRQKIHYCQKLRPLRLFTHCRPNNPWTNHIPQRIISNLTTTQLVVTMVFQFQWSHAFHEFFRWRLNSIRSLQTSSANWLLQSLISNSSRSYAPSWWRYETKWLQWPWPGDNVISYVRHAIRLENQRSAQILKIEIFSRKRLPHSKGAAPKQNKKIVWNGWSK